MQYREIEQESGQVLLGLGFVVYLSVIQVTTDMDTYTPNYTPNRCRSDSYNGFTNANS